MRRLMDVLAEANRPLREEQLPQARRYCEAHVLASTAFTVALEEPENEKAFQRWQAAAGVQAKFAVALKLTSLDRAELEPDQVALWAAQARRGPA